MKSRFAISSIALLAVTIAACHDNASNPSESPGPQALVQSGAAQVTSGGPHNRRVFVTEASLPADSYTSVEELDVGNVWYGSVAPMLDALAAEAQKKGADAVIEVKKGHHITALSWAAPHATGKAVRFRNPCAFNPSSVPGEYLPRDPKAGGTEPPITAACKTARAAAPAPVAPAASHHRKTATEKARGQAGAGASPETAPPDVMPPR